MGLAIAQKAEEVGSGYSVILPPQLAARVVQPEPLIERTN
jgi:hypothetical protein